MQHERFFSRIFWHEVWQLLTPFWCNCQRWRAWLLLLLVIAIDLGLVYLNVLFNDWNNDFYNAIQSLNRIKFQAALWKFTQLASIFIVLAVYQNYLNQWLQIQWRQWSTEYFITRWLQDGAFYRLPWQTEYTDNPDQRISEDVNQFVELTLSLSLGFLNATVTLFSFVFILWNLSGAFVWAGFTIPGYMVYAAIFYSLLGSWLTVKIGRPLAGLNFLQQRYEADFRFSLVRLREHAESIALLKGESAEKGRFQQQFSNIAQNFLLIMRQQKRLTWLNAGYNQIANIFPILVAAPRFFSQQIQLGGLMQIASAFSRVHEALSWLINSFTRVAEWQAVVNRLGEFSQALKQLPPRCDYALTPQPQEDFAGVAVTLRRPDGRILAQPLAWKLTAGERLLITGRSGCGKSTLLRAMAGIWPFGEGHISLPKQSTWLVLPQKPYLPSGTLQAALWYPQTHGTDVTQLSTLLEQVGLGYLCPLITTHADWMQRLSLGEQQRLAFIRALLQRPDILLLDEATASVDEAGEACLYRLLLETLPHCRLVSVGHRQSLQQWHSQRLHLDEWITSEER